MIFTKADRELLERISKNLIGYRLEAQGPEPRNVLTFVQRLAAIEQGQKEQKEQLGINFGFLAQRFAVVENGQDKLLQSHAALEHGLKANGTISDVLLGRIADKLDAIHALAVRGKKKQRRRRK